MSILTHFFSRPPEVRRFQPVERLDRPGRVERALDRFSVRQIIGGFATFVGGALVAGSIMLFLFGGLFLG